MKKVVRVNINSISNYHYIPPSTLGNCRYLFASTAAEECPLTSTSAGARRRSLRLCFFLAGCLQAKGKRSHVKMKFAAVLLALAGSAAAFAPSAQPKVRFLVDERNPCFVCPRSFC